VGALTLTSPFLLMIYYRRLIAHASVRYSSLTQVASHPFFTVIKWDNLRSVHAPFIPEINSEIDTVYYDDFTSPDDMEKYAEVLEKQRNVEQVEEKDEPINRGVWVGFTFGKNGPGPKANFIGSNDDGSLATIF